VEVQLGRNSNQVIKTGDKAEIKDQVVETERLKTEGLGIKDHKAEVGDLEVETEDREVAAEGGQGARVGGPRVEREGRKVAREAKLVTGEEAVGKSRGNPARKPERNQRSQKCRHPTA